MIQQLQRFPPLTAGASSQRLALLLTLLVSLWPAARAEAHEPAQPPLPLVIDSDMGLDDVLTLAAALQAPDLDLRALVIGEGVSDPARGLLLAQQLLAKLNRPDVTLYAAAATPTRPPPPFRQRVLNNISYGLEHLQLPGAASAQHPAHRNFSAAAYQGASGERLTVLALGPLTNLAAALEAEPALASRLARVVYVGQADPRPSWNTQRDPAALARLRAAGIPLEFVIKGPGGRKPAAWRGRPPLTGPVTSVGGKLWHTVLGDKLSCQHYVDDQPLFTDELGLLYLLSPELFAVRPLPRQPATKTVRPRRSPAIVARLLALLRQGRQQPAPVVSDLASLRDAQLAPDLAARRAALLARHGKVEWRAQLLQGELHQHLGPFSIIGVKMGLHAAELLNAPPHGLQVISHSGASPPVSCLNDGVMVATGATVGRQLFVHQPGAAGSTQVSFVAQGRRLTLGLKPALHEKLTKSITELARAHGSSSPDYWRGVRALGLRVWDRHRSEIFTVTAAN